LYSYIVETNNELDLELIASKCGIALGKSPDEVIRNVVNLEEYYEKNELIKINNYFLTVENNPQILTFLITNEKKFNNEETLPILIDLLLFKSKPKEINQDDYINVRVMCAKAIAHYKNTSVIAPLLYCLNNKDEHYKIRLACADVLGKIGDKYAVTPLINLLNDEEEQDLLEIMQPITTYGNVAFVSIDTNPEGDTKAYAQSYYQERFGYSSGTVFLIDMDERYLWIYSN